MDKEAAGAPGRHHGSGEGGRATAAMSTEEAVRAWEAVFEEEDLELAQVLFWDALLRDARTEYDRKARDEEEEDRRLARVFEPWQQPPAPAVSVPPLLAPAVERTVVLGLRAPPHLARRHNRAPSSGPAGERQPTAEDEKPRVL